MSSVRSFDALSAALSMGSRRSAQPPQEMLQIARAQRQNNPRPTPEQAANGVRDKGWTGQDHRPAGSFQSELRRMANLRDAARTTIVGENAGLWILRFAYSTHKPMEVWLDSKPADNKLKLRAIMTPSWHVGGDRAEKLKNGERYARSNEYDVEVRYPNGKTERQHVKMKNPPEYATASDVIEIDLMQKGDIRIKGWPSSTGAGGYTEGREFILHNP